jgi:nucleotide-binding universal stress UspA family protein
MYRRVLVPLDGSQEAEKVLPIIKELHTPGGEVILVHIISGETERTEAIRHLQEVAGRLGEDSRRWRYEVAVSRSVSQGILDVARREGVDLIAMYTHTHRGWARLMNTVAGDVQLWSPIEVKVFGPQELLAQAPIAASADDLGLAQSILRETDIFRSLSQEQIDQVASLAERSRVPAGRALARAGEVGERLFIIISGDAQLSANSAVGAVTVRIAGSGESFPLAALVGLGTLITSAESLTDMELLAIPRASLTGLCAAEPEIGTRVYSAIAEVFANRYSKTLAHLSISFQERVLPSADFLANV